MKRCIHIVPSLDDVANGMARVARFLAKEQGHIEVVDLKNAMFKLREGSAGVDECEVWVHGMWLPKEWMFCWRILREGKCLVRMTHGSLSPVYLKCQSRWKKWLVGPIERYFLCRCDRIIATCKAEKEWIEAYLGKMCPEIEVTDLKRFFDFSRKERIGCVEERENSVSRVECVGGVGGDFSRVERVDRVEGERFEARVPGSELERDENNSQLITHNSQLNLLYLGRRHPLKGVEFLEAAVRQLQNSTRSTRSTRLKIELKIVSNAFGEELEKVWEWCDVLVLPTLSENFGLVVAEALERGKRVITTDGAPVWGEGLSRVERVDCVEGELRTGFDGRLLYLKGYRDGTNEKRVELLCKGISLVVSDEPF